ncbi:MAG: hypothetical protein HOO96_26345, partial [Polyangiaceae bacterium]|nr:hypothetical protein [Polyangiaceae bacterium]
MATLPKFSSPLYPASPTRRFSRADAAVEQGRREDLEVTLSRRSGGASLSDPPSGIVRSARVAGAAPMVRVRQNAPVEDGNFPFDRTLADATVNTAMGTSGRIKDFGRIELEEPVAPAPSRRGFGVIELELGEPEEITRVGRVDPRLLRSEGHPADGDGRTSISSLSAHIASFVARPAVDGRVPRVVLPMDQITRLPIDHRAGFLLAHIDGTQTMEE